MFDSELSIRAKTATTWELSEPLVWTGTKGDTFAVPTGFVTDFASVPRFLHWLVLPYGAYTRAAVLHDWLLTELAHPLPEIVGDHAPERAWPPANSRDCDGIFRKVMEELGVPWAKRWAMWAAVRLAACFNEDRAYGRQFGRDAFKVFGLALLAGPVVLPGAVGVLISLGIVRLFTWGRRA